MNHFKHIQHQFKLLVIIYYLQILIVLQEKSLQGVYHNHV
jgi:hypothetical protein